MLFQRLLVVIVLVPLVALLAAVGGIVFQFFIALVLSIAVWEFWRIFYRGGYAPSKLLMIGGVLLLTLAPDREVFGFDGSAFVFSLLLLVTMTVHLVAYERGGEGAFTDFCITIAGAAYLGWLGKYLIYLRALPDGLWWLLLVIPAVWLTDVGGYLLGGAFGRHKMAVRLSPKKSWEGYAGGIVFAVLGSMLLAALWNLRSPMITVGKGAVIGLVISILSPLGDLGISMLKRQFGLKDTSRLLPGHGGMLDRIDSMLWSGVLGYYLIVILWL
ncbi:MAG: phosphatidate cytidylyltransferase [Anaerolineae bacterium]|nr:phosphatidate cytidylyltransferase [Anaerolineae bacterium]